MTTFNENRKLVKEMDTTKKRNGSPPLLAIPIKFIGYEYVK
jgi:hypothetical protein